MQRAHERAYKGEPWNSTFDPLDLDFLYVFNTAKGPECRPRIDISNLFTCIMFHDFTESTVAAHFLSYTCCSDYNRMTSIYENFE